MPLQESEILALLEKSRLEVTHKFEVVPVCLEIENKDEFEFSIFGTYGNFSTVIAPPKVGKTTLVAIPVAAYLSKKPICGFIPKTANNKKVVLWVDTEQGKNEALTTLKTICRFGDLGDQVQPENLKYITLRQYGNNIRVLLIEYLIYHTPNLGLVIIDGIRDLINSINDEREATFISGKLLKWSEERNIHIITILHQNKGDGNARGHLGTELMNKAETVINLSRDVQNGERQTIVEPKYNRHKEFRNFAIVLRENKPQVVGVTEYIPENPKVDQLTHIQKINLLNTVFEKDVFIPYTKLWQTIKIQLFNTCKIKFGDNKCKELIKTLTNENFIMYDDNLRQFQRVG